MNSNKITSSWTFSFIATYGAIALLTGLYTAIFNIFTQYYDSFSKNEYIFKFILFTLAVPIFLAGAVAILNLVIFIILQTIKQSYKYVLIFLILLFSAIYVTPYLDCGHGAGIYFIYYFVAGIPIVIVLFIIPTLILFFLEIFNKIPPPKKIIPSETWIMILALYTILSPFIFLFSILGG